MPNPMETNKLLTLEEIEKMEASVDSFDAKTKAFFARKGVTLNALLATARAYRHTFDVLKNNIPRMRQWLNEDRITDVKRLVDNEDLSFWLLDMPLPDGESLPSGGGFTDAEKEKIVKFFGSKQ